MTRRITVVSVSMVAALVLAATAAYAGFPGRPIASDISVWWTGEGDNYRQVMVEQKVFEGDSVDLGTWKYRYEITNDGSGDGGALVGLGSPMHEWGFTQNLNGGVPTIINLPGDWSAVLTGPSSSGLTNAPYFTSPTGLPVSSDLVAFEYISHGPPDQWYLGQAVNSDPFLRVTGETTGPTPEPCTVALLGLGLSGAGMIRLLKRRRE